MPPPAPEVALPAAGWTRATRLAALAAGLVPFGVYLATLSPTVNGGDSGEFVAVAYLFGVAHPPGYPLHALLGKLMTLLPLGSVAWRVNLLSALGDAGAAVLLFRALTLLTGDLAAGFLAAGAFAFAPLVWPYAITAEVFALNNLFAAGLLYWSARALREDAQGAVPLRTLCLSAFWVSLGLSNHHTLVFFAVPFGLLVLVLAGRRLLLPRVLGALAAATALGFLPYLYLPLAGARPAAVTWGDTATWSGFVNHFLRREYGTFRLADESVGSGGPVKVAVTAWLAAMLSEQLAPEQSPEKPANVEPATADAERETDVALPATKVQAAPQLTPAGFDVIVPEPVPARVTVSVWREQFGNLNFPTRVCQLAELVAP